MSVLQIGVHLGPGAANRRRARRRGLIPSRTRSLTVASVSHSVVTENERALRKYRNERTAHDRSDAIAHTATPGRMRRLG